MFFDIFFYKFRIISGIPVSIDHLHHWIVFIQTAVTFKTGGVDGCDCEETLKLIAEGKINTEPLITHTYPLSRIEEAYELFENKRDGVIKVAVEC